MNWAMIVSGWIKHAFAHCLSENKWSLDTEFLDIIHWTWGQQVNVFSDLIININTLIQSSMFIKNQKSDQGFIIINGRSRWLCSIDSVQSREPQAMRLQPRDISLYELLVIALFEDLLAESN